MRTVAVAAILFATLSLCGDGAQAAPWCAEYGGGSGGTNCGFYSFEQCMAARSGNGGFCSRNPCENSYSGAGDSRRRHRQNY
jgi:hypothetical protein